MTSPTGLVLGLVTHNAQLMDALGSGQPVLVIAPSGERSQALCATLEQLGFAVDYTPSPDHGVAQARDSGIALILIDAADLDGRGVGVIRTLRDEGNPAAILALTSPGDALGTIECIEAGADGCVRDTVSGAELVARLRALVRRSGTGWGGARGARVRWVIDDLRIDPSTRTVVRDAATIRLSPRELGVLLALLRRQGRAVSHEEVFREVWRRPSHRSAQRVASVINTLRRKLEHDQDNPRYIRTVRAGGYLIPRKEQRSHSSHCSNSSL
jgi:DNA-binding response OmpR family regulator